MSYILPAVQVSQEFTANPTLQQTLLSAFIVGPQYTPYRYNVAAEQPFTSAVNPDGSGNVYNHSANVAYPYPSQVAGTVVDESFVEVWLQNAKAQYFPNTPLGSNFANSAVELVSISGGSPVYPNRVRFTTGSGTVAATNTYANRSAFFSNRDVQVGDLIDITDNLGNTLSTKVAQILPDTSIQNGSLVATVGTSIASGADGVTNGTNTFSSASATFTQALVNQHLFIATIGTFLILAVPSATQLKLSSIPSITGTGLTFHINGVYGDVGNMPGASMVLGSPAYVWAGSGSDPGTTGLTIASAGTYVGYPAKRVAHDVYTVLCTTGGTIGSTNARFTVSSQNGVFTTVTGVSISSGSIAVDDNSGNSVSLTVSGGSYSFTAGQSWTVATTAAVATVLPTPNSTYTGAANITYQIAVTRGGAFYNGTNSSTCAQFTITSTNTDSSPQVLPVTGVAFPVGTLGVTATFSSTPEASAFILGDVYYIDAVAATTGALKILVLNDNLPTATLTISSTISCILSENIASIEIPEIANIISDTLNWVATENTLTLNSGITVTDSNLLSGITPAALPVLTGNVYIQHRDLVLTNSLSVGSVTSTANIPAILGIVDPVNPLAQGVYEAANNSATTPVYFIAVPSDDLEGYTAALGIAATLSGLWGVVPMTFDSGIQAAVINFVNGQSTPAVGKWAVAWLSSQLQPTALLYNLQPNNAPWTGTITADPLNPSKNTLVTIAGATFLTTGVRYGDQVLFNFTTLPDGTAAYQTYTVASVRTQTSLVLTTALASPINVPTKIQIQRVYTNDEQINNLAAVSAGFNNLRVRNVFPDTVQTDGVVKPGYMLAAALAGLRSGVAPQQGLTNVSVLGFDTLTESVTQFTQTQLNTLAGGGTWIVTQATLASTPYTRHQLTTAYGVINTQEDSIVAAADAFAYALKAALQIYIGKYNNNPNTLVLVKDATNALISYYQTQSGTATAGPLLLAGSQINSIGIDPNFKDHLNISLNAAIPAPLNNIAVVEIII